MAHATRAVDDDTTVHHGELITTAMPRTRARHLAGAGFVARYSGTTRVDYTRVLTKFFTWCDSMPIDVFEVKRAHLELYLRQLEELEHNVASTVVHKVSILNGFYRFAVADGYCEASPTLLVRRPHVQRGSTTEALSAPELQRLLAVAKADSPHTHALICLLGLNGMRVSGACGVQIKDLGFDEGYTTVDLILKGGDRWTVSVSQPTAWAIATVRGDREIGPLLWTTTGRPMDRIYALRNVRRLVRLAGIAKRITPHSLRHTFVTLALDAGVSHRDIMASTGHTDPRMVPYYDRRRNSIVRNATHAVTATVYGAA